MITRKRIEQLLDFNPSEGVFTWKVNRGGSAKKGSIAGGIDSKGYRQIRIDMKLYLAHRIVWLLTHGIWPDHDIDHIDRNPLNIRPDNLRRCSDSENQQNVGTRADNKSGAAGVYLCKKTLKWKAHITLKGKTIHLGTFSSFGNALNARLLAKKSLHTFHPEQKIQAAEICSESRGSQS